MLCTFCSWQHQVSNQKSCGKINHLTLTNQRCVHLPWLHSMIPVWHERVMNRNTHCAKVCTIAFFVVFCCCTVMRKRGLAKLIARSTFWCVHVNMVTRRYIRIATDTVMPNCYTSHRTLLGDCATDNATHETRQKSRAPI
jgi:hypothetical protein